MVEAVTSSVGVGVGVVVSTMHGRAPPARQWLQVSWQA